MQIGFSGRPHMRHTLIALAVLSLSVPAFAQEQEWAGDDDLSWQEEVEPQDQGPSFDDFRNDRELSWAGEWTDTPEYGPVWRPTHVDSDWRPYLNGRWEWTTAGWTWMSEEPFGWAVYHYGRWAFGPLGWTWVPGRVWAPAWVAWRWGDGYAGWCPLGPRMVVVEQPTLWVYVGSRHFLQPVRRHVVPWREAHETWGTAQALPIRRGPRAGPVVTQVERATGRGLRPLELSDAPSAPAPRTWTCTGRTAGRSVARMPARPPRARSSRPRRRAPPGRPGRPSTLAACLRRGSSARTAATPMAA
jgi:hypothetical protein